MIAVIAKLVDLIVKKTIKDKSYEKVAFDVMEVTYTKMQSCLEKSVFADILEDPGSFIKTKSVLRKVFETLKENNKIIIMISNYPIKILDLLLKSTIDKDWLELFDLCISDAKSPLFQITESPFFQTNLKGEKL
jgi:hypothetical protein